MAKQEAIGVGVVLAIVGILLLARPDCYRGCRTVAEHLLVHGLDDLIAGLLS
jgi:hypothetical protein